MNSRDAFKSTLAGQSYIKLYEIFARAPDSPDKASAIAVLTEAFNDHFQLWLMKRDAPAE